MINGLAELLANPWNIYIFFPLPPQFNSCPGTSNNISLRCNFAESTLIFGTKLPAEKFIDSYNRPQASLLSLSLSLALPPFLPSSLLFLFSNFRQMFLINLAFTLLRKKNICLSKAVLLSSKKSSTVTIWGSPPPPHTPINVVFFQDRRQLGRPLLAYSLGNKLPFICDLGRKIYGVSLSIDLIFSHHRLGNVLFSCLGKIACISICCLMMRNFPKDHWNYANHPQTKPLVVIFCSFGLSVFKIAMFLQVKEKITIETSCSNSKLLL